MPLATAIAGNRNQQPGGRPSACHQLMALLEREVFTITDAGTWQAPDVATPMRRQITPLGNALIDAGVDLRQFRPSSFNQVARAGPAATHRALAWELGTEASESRRRRDRLIGTGDNDGAGIDRNG